MEPQKSPFISEDEKLAIRLKRTHTERFRMLMRLIKLSKKLQEAKIIHVDVESTKNKKPRE